LYKLGEEEPTLRVPAREGGGAVAQTIKSSWERGGEYRIVFSTGNCPGGENKRGIPSPRPVPIRTGRFNAEGAITRQKDLK